MFAHDTVLFSSMNSQELYNDILNDLFACLILVATHGFDFNHESRKF